MNDLRMHSGPKVFFFFFSNRRESGKQARFGVPANFLSKQTVQAQQYKYNTTTDNTNTNTRDN